MCVCVMCLRHRLRYGSIECILHTVQTQWHITWPCIYYEFVYRQAQRVSQNIPIDSPHMAHSVFPHVFSSILFSCLVVCACASCEHVLPTPRLIHMAHEYFSVFSSVNYKYRQPRTRCGSMPYVEGALFPFLFWSLLLSGSAY